MGDNDSYDLAAEFVVEQINDQLNDEHVLEGTEVDVADLQDCDCIPINVRDQRGRAWDISGVQCAKYSRDIDATYKAR